jgi:hypothetical protein
MDETPETFWLRCMLESECIDWTELTDEELEELLDSWCAQAQEENVPLSQKQFRRLAFDWVKSKRPLADPRKFPAPRGA